MPRHAAATVPAVLLLTLAFGSGPAQASDPLLSGYAGPGGGEQAILGATFVPAEKGNGSLRAPARKRPPGGPSRRAGVAGRPAAPSAPPVPVPAPAPSGSAAGGAGSGGTDRRSADPAAGAPATGESSAPSSAKTRPAQRDPTAAAPLPGTAPVPTPSDTLTEPATDTARAPSLTAARTSAGPLPLTRGQVLGVLGALCVFAVCAAVSVALVPHSARRWI